MNLIIYQQGIFETPDDRSHHKVSPLWCAAVTGKLPVVELLVRYGADINSVSDSGSTAVRSACANTQIEIVKFLVENGADILKHNHNGGTCLINSVQSTPLCEFLLEAGATVNAQDLHLQTALHYAIHEDRLETAVLLLRYGADPFISNRSDDDALRIACLSGATRVFSHLIAIVPYTRKRIAEAYELIGSTRIDEHFELAVDYWRNALAIREDDNPRNGIGGRIEKQLPPPNPVYLNAREFRSNVELNAIIGDMDAMRIQSLMIRERIIGTQHGDTINWLAERSSAHAEVFQFQRCVDLWKYSLVLRIRKDGLLHVKGTSAVYEMLRLFRVMKRKMDEGTTQEQLRYQDVYETIELICVELASCQELLQIKPVFKQQSENFDRILKILTHLMYIPNEVSTTPELKEWILRLAVRIKRLSPINSVGDSLLHLAASKIDIVGSSIFPAYELCELFIRAGFSASAQNSMLETPLHAASYRYNFNQRIVQLLLSHGAHIDRKDSNGNMPYRRLAANPNCTIKPLNYISLQCLAARNIMEHNIPFGGMVPVDLEEFIRMH